MNLQTLLGTCLAIIVAEMGDKTQLAAFGATAATRRPLEVFLGAMAGFAVVTLLAVAAGRWVGEYLSPRVLRLAGGLLFMGIGLSMLLQGRR